MVGGGAVAQRKVRSLLLAGAKVTVVSPTLTKSLLRLAQSNKIKYFKRAYCSDDAKGKFVVIAATSDAKLNSLIASHAERLVNVVDSPELSNFIVPSSFCKPPLQIAISTDSPLASRLIRLDLQRRYSRDFIKYLKLIATLRQKAKRLISDASQRKEFLHKCINEQIVQELQDLGYKELRKKLITIMEGMC